MRKQLLKRILQASLLLHCIFGLQDCLASYMEDEIYVYVDDKVITKSDFELRKKTLKQAYNITVGNEDILDDLIDERIVEPMLDLESVKGYKHKVHNWGELEEDVRRDLLTYISVAGAMNSLFAEKIDNIKLLTGDEILYNEKVSKAMYRERLIQSLLAQVRKGKAIFDVSILVLPKNTEKVVPLSRVLAINNIDRVKKLLESSGSVYSIDRLGKVKANEMKPEYLGASLASITDGAPTLFMYNAEVNLILYVSNYEGIELPKLPRKDAERSSLLEVKRFLEMKKIKERLRDKHVIQISKTFSN